MTPEEASARSERAKQILEDPLFSETLSIAEDALLRAVKSAKTEHEAYKAAIALQVFDLLVGQIRSHMDTAKVMSFNFAERRSRWF